ncbi:4-hydroxybenzoate 3-monooxygenase [Spirosoma endbachense]|uniref:4-hydroxybenzoate 3-monooxygenase n=1 Tax=Spirosoma endbachense TaxID=2666025 RepID=A0A6P1W4R8_9BACT|nr:4-hydroxybenzoate 3-monooxygenase [Spirosoma endbachense]QHW00452.1 4-hydroxybenzoate 3-monooxygenase [Spirosoma endbachense]
MNHHTQVGIIGAGPAGLLLSQLLHQEGIRSVVLENRTRERVESRQRAGLLEQNTVDRLQQAGASDRLDREGLVHDGVILSYNGQRHRIDLAQLTDGSRVTIYAQTEVVKDLIRLRLDADSQQNSTQRSTAQSILFEAEAKRIDGLETPAPTIHYTQNGEKHTLTCDFVAGCDGFHGISRASIPSELTKVYDKVYPYCWLGILAKVPPSTHELIYAYHERGFALHSMRSSEISRLYVQCNVADRLEDWPDERIWSELQIRLGSTGWVLAEGPILEKTITPMRSFVSEPMQHGRLFLAGDSAHIVPPTGAKGLNMAVADTGHLFDALMTWYREGSRADLDTYTEGCMRRVWRVQEFSNFMTELLHHNPERTPFDAHLQASRFNQLITSQAASALVAENYVGLAAKQSAEATT